MPLPTITYPTFITTVPSTGNSVKIRPYNVGEEKVFLIAAESNDAAQVKLALQQIITACTFNSVDVTKLTTFDIEWLFLQIRARSVAETFSVNVQIAGCPENKEKMCKTLTKVDIKIADVKLLSSDAAGKQIEFSSAKFKEVTSIKLNDDPSIQLAIQVRYPNFNDLEIINKFVSPDSDKDDIGYELTARCTVAIFEKNSVYKPSDFTIEELKDWFKKLERSSLKKIEDFFKTIPAISYTTTVKCEKCSKEQSYTLEGISDFFA